MKPVSPARVFALTLLWTSGPALADCEVDNAEIALTEALERAERAFGDDDPKPFWAAIDEAANVLGCQDVAVSPEVAARYHRLRAAMAYAVASPPLDDDERLAVQRITSAACALAPLARYPDHVAEPDDDLAKWLAMDLACRAVEAPEVPRPPQGDVLLDGRPVLRWAPADAEITLQWPVVYQRIDPTGQVLQTSWLGSGERLPTFPVSPKKRPAGGHALIGVGAAAMVAGAVTAGLSGVLTDQVCERHYAGSPSCETTSIEKDQRDAYLGAGLGGVGVGLALITGGSVWATTSRHGASVGITVKTP
jgi:hypothetical protein